MKLGHTILAMLSLFCDLPASVMLPLPWPHEIVKCSSDAHFRISVEVVGHPGIFRLLFYEYHEFRHILVSHTAFLLLHCREVGIFRVSDTGRLPFNQQL